MIRIAAVRGVRASVAALVLCLASTAAYGASNLIKNGSFEKPVVAVGGYQVFSTGDTFSHWTTVGDSGNVAIVSGAFTQNGFSFPAKAGQQWLDLTGVSQTATGVAQKVVTVPGQAYTLTFFVGNAYDPGGIFGVSSTVNVLVNGQQAFTATNTKGKGKTLQVWQKFITTIMATSSKTTIAFINGDPSNDTQNGLDKITLVPQGD